MPFTYTPQVPDAVLPYTLRALTFDDLGRIKVIESRSKQGDPKVVQTWGQNDQDASRGVVAVSLADRVDPLLAVARRDGTVDVISPITGERRYHLPEVSYRARRDDSEGDEPERVDAEMDDAEMNDAEMDDAEMDDAERDGAPLDDAVKDGATVDGAEIYDPIVCLHLFAKEKSPTVLSCTKGGVISTMKFNESREGFNCGFEMTKEWNVNGSGHTFFGEVDASEQFHLYGGEPDAIGLCDVDLAMRSWRGDLPCKGKRNTKTWFTCATFLEDNHHQIVAANNVHEVHLFDIKAYKTPKMSMTFWSESLDNKVPITALATNRDGHTIYIGNESGDIASVDIRKGTWRDTDRRLFGCLNEKVIGCFEKLTTWSNMDVRSINISPTPRCPIKFIRKHPVHPLIVTGGFDDCLRFWNVESRKAVSMVYHMQHLTNIIFDSNFS